MRFIPESATGDINWDQGNPMAISKGRYFARVESAEYIVGISLEECGIYYEKQALFIHRCKKVVYQDPMVRVYNARTSAICWLKTEYLKSPIQFPSA
jgi:hypothetical protein